jgi:hypothetical protein
MGKGSHDNLHFFQRAFYTARWFVELVPMLEATG